MASCDGFRGGSGGGRSDPGCDERFRRGGNGGLLMRAVDDSRFGRFLTVRDSDGGKYDLKLEEKTFRATKERSQANQ